MKYIIDGKPAYLIAKKKGISIKTFYQRVKGGWSIKDAATKHPEKDKTKYIIKGNEKFVCYSTSQVAKYLRTSKGTICGLFYRQGDKIELFGYTIERRVRRENKTGANL